MNQLKMSLQQSIIALRNNGWSRRRIARELGIYRSTVAKYLRAASPSVDSKPAIVPPGSENDPGAKPAIVPAGARAGRPSQCQAWEVQIQTGMEGGLSAQRIYQDLVTDHQFAGNYDAVKRFVRRLGRSSDLPFRRMECEPAQEAQVDFGQGAWVVQEGKRRRPHLFRIVLSHSRKGYSEAVWQQTTESFIRSLENAFRHFGGVPRTLVIDNLRAAVSRADWFDPLLNPKVCSFCEHYGTVILPTKPAMPRHKGKIEAGVKYVQNNALKKRVFGALAEQNHFLGEWEKSVADTRIHGTTRQQVGRLFATLEQSKLLALPAMVFPCFQEAPRSVHRDGYVEVARAYYSVPPEYMGRSVWVRWDLRLVRVFNQRMEPIALHCRHEPGRFSTDPVHIHSQKRSIIERGADWLLERAGQLGPPAGQWAQSMMANRGPQGIRVLQGFLSLAEKHSPKQINEACRLALSHGAWRLSELRGLLERPCEQDQLEFISEHPLIRNLSEYQNLLPDCFETNPENPENESTIP